LTNRKKCVNIYSTKGEHPKEKEINKMKKGNVYVNSMDSVIKITSVKNDMVFVAYNGKRKTPIEKSTFEKWINDGVIKGV
jgi:hypothetical protein